MDETILRRLVYVKSLYNLATEDFQKGTDVTISRSIVTLDNCIETFCWVILREKESDKSPRELKKQRGEFYGLLQWIHEYDNNLDVNSIKELHEVRNNIQHHGQLIAKSQAERLFVAASVLIYDLTKSFFRIDFDDISLSVLIKSSKIRQLIHECEKYFEEEDFQNAAKKLIIGFELAKLNRQANQFGSGITDRRSDAEHSMKKYSILKDVVDYVTTLDSEIEVMKLGLDYMNWRVYRLLLGTMDPHVYLYDDWELKKELNTKQMILFEEKPDYIGKWVRSNLTFVIESILRWQISNPAEELSPFNIFKGFIDSTKQS